MDDLNKIHLRVDLAPSNLFVLHDYELLIEKLSEEITEYFKSNGIKYSVMPIFQGGGGGGLESFMEALKYVFSNKDIISFSISLMRFFVFIPFFLNKIFTKAQQDTRPRIIVNLCLETKENIDEEEYPPIDRIFVEKLLNLKNIGDDIYKLITEKRPSFIVDMKFSISIYKKSFKTVYLLTHDQRSSFNSFRLVNFIKAFKLKNNTEYFYEFFGLSKLFLSSRTDFNIEYDKEYHYLKAGFEKTKKYFFIFSSSLFRE